jgi:hypothetical protein
MLTLKQHSVAATYNNCAFSKMNSYFRSGTLPGNNYLCPLETGPFNVTFAGPLQKRSDFREVMEGFEKMRRRL